METYIWKVILCSAIFLVIYYTLLERLKNHHFKRFYLIAALVFSITVPLLRISYGVQIIESPAAASEFIAVNGTAFTPKTSFFTTENILYFLYSAVTLILLLRFVRNLLKIRKQIIRGDEKQVENCSLILLQEKVSPHSFLHYIFLNKHDFETGIIDRKIIRHEQAHAVQKHSIDLIFIELLLVFFWFNPALYFYKKAMLTNHEFLADDAVLKKGISIEDYQNLLYNSLSENNSKLTNSFNINNIKKRFKMMNTPKTRFDSWISLSTVPIAALLFFAFVNKIPAQIIQNKTEKKNVQKAEVSAKKAEIQTKNSSALETSDSAIQRLDQVETLSENPQQPMDTIRPKKTAATKSVINVEEIQKTTEAATQKRNLETDDIPAEYPGGTSKLREAIVNNFDFSKMKGKQGLHKGVVWIMIPHNSPYPDLFFEFEDEDMLAAVQEAVSKAMTEKWKPATKDGKPVDYKLKLPISMSFE